MKSDWFVTGVKTKNSAEFPKIMHSVACRKDNGKSERKKQPDMNRKKST
jgi:hypothetical protein